MENNIIIFISIFLICIIFYFSFYHCPEKFSNFQKPQYFDSIDILEQQQNELNQKQLLQEIENELNYNQFQDTNKISNNKCVTLYYANWCSHCHNVLPYFNEIMNENKNENIIYRKIENDELLNNPQEMDKIQGYPTILINYKNKDYIYNGSRDKTSLLKYIYEL
jgi:thiol-disulfide isomerase/thioredoxin